MNRRAWVEGGRTVAFGDERIGYRVEGAGPTILFAHGFPTSSHDWAPVIEQLATRYRCVSFDFLGFGESSKPRRAYSYPLQHEVLAKVVAAAGVARAVLVVHDYATSNDGVGVQPRLLHYIAERRGRRDALLAALRSATRKAFVWGMDDPVSGKHVLDAIRPLVEGAPICELSGVGHYPQLEAPDEVAAFIDGIASTWTAT